MWSKCLVVSSVMLAGGASLPAAVTSRVGPLEEASKGDCTVCIHVVSFNIHHLNAYDEVYNVLSLITMAFN